MGLGEQSPIWLTSEPAMVSRNCTGGELWSAHIPPWVQGCFSHWLQAPWTAFAGVCGLLQPWELWQGRALTDRAGDGLRRAPAAAEAAGAGMGGLPRPFKAL